MTEKKRGRGRPKRAPINLKWNWSLRERLSQMMQMFTRYYVKQTSLQKKIQVLLQGLRVYNDRNGAVRFVLQWLFDDNIVSRLPEGKTPYGDNPAPASDLTETSLRFEFNKLKYYVTDELDNLRRETMWIQLLEGIPAKSGTIGFSER